MRPVENDSRRRGRGELGSNFRLGMYTQKLTFEKKSGGGKGMSPEVTMKNKVETQQEAAELYLDKLMTYP